MDYIGISIGLVAGVIITWFLRKFMVERDLVRRSLLEEATRSLTKAETELRVLQTNLSESRLLLDQLRTEKEIHAKDLAIATTALHAVEAQFQATTKQLEAALVELQTLREEVHLRRSENDVLREKNETIKREIEGLGEKYAGQFKILANEILEDKSKRFTEENQKNIRLILDPLNTDLKEFRKKVEETYEKENKQRFSLEERIRELVQLNNKISEDANNLTNALKGNRKMQGDWGEMILETILQQSGLTEGREYTKQTTLRDASGEVMKNEEGGAMRPDFIIWYPDKRQLIIDSKVSLNAYERFSSAETETLQKQALEQHLHAIYQHIDTLSKKQYHALAGAADFVMMFVPIEPAYLLAMQADQSLWNYAFRKRIILISPTNLIAAIKLIAEVWKKDEAGKNAALIAERGKKLYEKFVGFVESLEGIGDGLQKAQDNYQTAMNRLQTGRDNLILQSEKLRRLGIDTQKSLPGKFTDETDLTENNPLTD